MSYPVIVSTASHAKVAVRRAQWSVGRWLICLSLLYAQLTLADTSLWQVSKDGHSLYLGGTLHVLRAADYPLPAPFQRAFEEADLIVFETDLRASDSVAFQRSLLAKTRYPDGENLADHLSEPAKLALRQYCRRAGIALEALLPYRPGWAILTLLSIELRRLGIAATGVDHHFMQQALAEDRPMVGLESAEEQLSFIVQLGAGNESELILHTLDELKQLESLLDQMVSMWRRGDTEALYDTFVEPMAVDYPEIYRALLVERNNAWLGQLEQHMRRARGSALVLVGVAHLVGQDGLLTLLADQGYRIVQL